MASAVSDGVMRYQRLTDHVQKRVDVERLRQDLDPELIRSLLSLTYGIGIRGAQDDWYATRCRVLPKQLDGPPVAVGILQYHVEYRNIGLKVLHKGVRTVGIG